MAKKFSIKKVAAGVLAALMVVTALPVSGISASTAKAAESDTVKVYRSYNPNSGEHLFTIDKSEHETVVSDGRDDEGVRWLAPKTSSTPVYRSYNPNTGEHLLVPQAEAEWLATQGWDNEGIKMYSDDNKTEGIYRLYNPNAINTKYPAASHVYTGSKEEAEWLVAQGWIYDNNGEPVIYAVSQDVTQDLALESVEGAAMDSASKTYNVVIAYFNKEVGDLKASDIQIRRVSDNQLFSVEKVEMSSDKKTATLTLANSSAAGAGVVGLSANVDYNLIVSSTEGNASKEFYIPAVATENSVIGINPIAKTITLAEEATGATATTEATTKVTLTVPDSLEVNFEEVLGRTVTARYDKSNMVTELRVRNEEVVYGAFAVNNTAVAGDGCLVDLATGKKYASQGFVTVASDITPTWRIDRAASGAAVAKVNASSELIRQNFDDATAGYDGSTAGYTHGEGIAYAKLVLNTNGTVKTMVVEDVWGNGSTAQNTANILVTKVNGTTVLGGTTEVSLKDYVIVKDGKMISASDIKEDDVVYYNIADKFAEVYNDKRTGTLENVYDGRFAFGGKTYNESGTQPANLSYVSRYIDGSIQNVDNDYMNSLKSSGKDISVYFNRAGQPVYVTGTLGEVKTTTEKVILTANSETYPQSLTDYLRLKGWNGTEVKTYDIDVTKLESVTVAAGTTYAKGYDTAGEKDATSGGFGPKGAIHFTTATGVVEKINLNAAGTRTTGTDVITAGTDLMALDYIELTLNEDGVVIGINFEDAAATKENPTAALSAGLKTITTAAGTYQLGEDTPIYVTSASAITKIAYKDFSGTVPATNTAVYSYDEKNVTAIVVPLAKIAGGTSVTSVEGVIAGIERNPSSDNYITELTVVSGNGISTETAEFTKKYTKFAKHIDMDALVVGDIITIQVAADGETINGIVANGDTDDGTIADGTGSTSTDHVNDGIQKNQDINIVSTEKQTFKATFSSNDLAYATKATPTVVKVENGVISCIDFATMISLAETSKVNLSMMAGSDYYVDTIVVISGSTRSATTAQYAAAKTVIDAAVVTIDGEVPQLTGSNSGVSDSAAHLNAAVEAAVKSKADTIAAAPYTVTADAGSISIDTTAGNKNKVPVTISGSGYTVTIIVEAQNPAS